MTETAVIQHPGMILGFARFFYDPRGSMRGVIESRPTEARLFAYALIAAAIILLSRTIDIVTANPPTENPVARLMEQAVSMLFFVPLVYYALAAIGTFIARLFGGRGSWQDGRAAFFWAALVSAPVLLITSHAGDIFAGAPRVVPVVISQFGQVFFAWALAQCFAEAFGFSRAWVVFTVIAAPIFVLLLLLWMAQS